MIYQFQNYGTNFKMLFCCLYQRGREFPIHYIKEVLNATIETVGREGTLFRMLQRYVSQSVTKKIKNIFEISRYEDQMRFEQYQDQDQRILLFHGTKNENMLSII